MGDEGGGADDPRELTLLDQNIRSVQDIPRISQMAGLTSLNLHSNKLTDMNGLEHLVNLTELNLSSNDISVISCLGDMKQLKYLNLSSNRIQDITGLANLEMLEKLWIGYNVLSSLIGLEYLPQPSPLKYLDVKANKIKSLKSVRVISRFQNLEEIVFDAHGHDNPVCRIPGYLPSVLRLNANLKQVDRVFAEDIQKMDVKHDVKGKKPMPGAARQEDDDGDQQASVIDRQLDYFHSLVAEKEERRRKKRTGGQAAPASSSSHRPHKVVLPKVNQYDLSSAEQAPEKKPKGKYNAPQKRNELDIALTMDVREKLQDVIAETNDLRKELTWQRDLLVTLKEIGEKNLQEEQEVNIELGDFKATIQEMLTQNKRLQGMMEKRDKQISKLQKQGSQKDEVTQQLAATQAELRHLQQENERLKSQVETRENKINELAVSQATWLEEKPQLVTAASLSEKYQQENERLTNKNHELEQEACRLRSDCEFQRGRLGEMAAQVDKAEQQAADQVRELHTALKSTSDHLSEVSSQMEQLKEELRLTTIRQKEAEEAAAVLREELDASRTERISLTVGGCQTDLGMDELDKEARDLNSDVERLMVALEESHTDLSNTRKALRVAVENELRSSRMAEHLSGVVEDQNDAIAQLQSSEKSLKADLEDVTRKKGSAVNELNDLLRRLREMEDYYTQWRKQSQDENFSLKERLERCQVEMNQKVTSHTADLQKLEAVKTELSQTIQIKDTILGDLNNTISDLRQRLTTNADDAARKERVMRDMEAEIEDLRRDLTCSEKDASDYRDELKRLSHLSDREKLECEAVKDALAEMQREMGQKDKTIKYVENEIIQLQEAFKARERDHEESRRSAQESLKQSVAEKEKQIELLETQTHMLESQLHQSENDMRVLLRGIDKQKQLAKAGVSQMSTLMRDMAASWTTFAPEG